MIHMIAMVAALTVNSAYSHPATDTAAVYFTVENKGAGDTLEGARCSAAASAGLHQSMPAMGSMSATMMMPIVSVHVPEHGSVTFQPGGYHVMLEHLKHPLAVGQHFTLALHFARAGWIDVPVTVRPY